MRPTKFDLVLAIVLCLGGQSMRAATTSGRATSDPQALLLVAKSAAVLTGGVVLQDVLLTGNVIHIAGSDYDIGAAKLEVSGNGRSRLDVAMGDKRRIEIRSDASGDPEGAWLDESGAKQGIAQHDTSQRPEEKKP